MINNHVYKYIDSIYNSLLNSVTKLPIKYSEKSKIY